MDPADNEPEAPPVVRAARKTDWRLVAVVLATPLGLFVFAAFGYFGGYANRLLTSPALARMVSVAGESPEVRDALGTNLKAMWWPSGEIDDYRPYGYAAISTAIAGSKGSGRLDAVANRVGRNWMVERAIVTVGGRRINATPPTLREPVRYPARGMVLLQPLDAQSNADVQEFPWYFKNRLDVDAAILPTLTPPESLVDPKTHQLIGEHVWNWIEETHGGTLADLDAVIIAVTHRDMNMRTWDNDWAVNYRHGRVVVISTARLENRRRLGRWSAEEYAVRGR
jgi:hypothetical protein